jgi:hypothetical protein
LGISHHLGHTGEDIKVLLQLKYILEPIQKLKAGFFFSYTNSMAKDLEGVRLETRQGVKCRNINTNTNISGVDVMITIFCVAFFLKNQCYDQNFA